MLFSWIYTNLSSTYLYQIDDVLVAVVMACLSNVSMCKLAAIGETGDTRDFLGTAVTWQPPW